MQTPAAAIAWEFRQRHRWGFAALALYLLALGVIRLIAVRSGRVAFHDAETFALAVIVPLTAIFIYFLAIFSFGLSGDLAARQSIFPTRMFTLPVTSSALAGWPMLYGSLAVMAVWFATRFLGVWPAGSDVPIAWPALLAASLLCWTQALTWMTYPLPGLRVAITVLWLATIDAIVLIALDLKASEAVMLAILLPHVPLAFLVARSAVARARRGEVPDWRVRVDSRSSARNFRTAASALTWFEWRQHGRALPMLVAIVLPFELSLLFVFREVPVIVNETIAMVLCTPPFMAMFVAASVSSGLTTFTTTRPLTDGGLIAAKLKATIASTLVTWWIVLAALALTSRAALTDLAHQLAAIVGVPRAIAVGVVLIAMPMLVTWKQLVQSLFIGMSGRTWLPKASVFAALAFLAIAVPLAHWAITTDAALRFLWNALPWIIAALVIVKTAAAMWIGTRLPARQLVATAIVYNVAVFTLYALLVWIFPELIVRHYLLAFLAIVAVPLVRVSAAPLALSRSRHA
ncbi:MAG TPA: hypothetical protein VJ853_00305 [Thermoanaerobaculia bacterium]|nr:hypothetical protein [Thermoanaerobaculia bacterium]